MFGCSIARAFQNHERGIVGGRHFSFESSPQETRAMASSLVFDARFGRAIECADFQGLYTLASLHGDDVGVRSLVDGI